MKIRPHRNLSRSGVTLIEALVYIALVGFLLVCGTRFSMSYFTTTRLLPRLLPGCSKVAARLLPRLLPKLLD